MDIIRKLKQTLANSGLIEEEISFYINVLKKPNHTIYDIAKRSKVPKDRAYKIFHSLEDKNLLIDDKRKHKKIKAAPLNTFIETLYGQGRKFYRTADSLKEVKPFLPFLSLPDQENTFQTFTAEDLAEEYLDLSYLNWDQVLAYGNFEMVIPIMGTTPDKQFVKRRLKRGKRCFPILANPGDYSWEVVSKDDLEMRRTKVIFNDKLKDYFVILMPDINKTSFWVRDEKGMFSGAVVESPLITKLHENIYKHFDEISEYQHPPNFVK